jgi:hypothetical protein
MIWRGPWDGRWDGSWEGQDQPLAPGFVRGAAAIRVGSTGNLGDGDTTIIGWLAGSAPVTVGAAGAIGALAGLTGAAAVTIGGAGRLVDPDAPVTYVLQGGGGDSKRRPVYRGKKKRLDEEMQRARPLPPAPEPVWQLELDVPAIIREQIAAAILQKRAFVPGTTLQKPGIVTQPPEQRIAPAGIAPEWFGIPTVVEDMTEFIAARNRRARRRLLLLAAAQYYEEAA